MNERQTTTTGAARLVHVDSLTIRYGRKTVLDDVSLGVEAGQVLALVGRNGAGKSSLVRCLLGQQAPNSGHVRLFGLDPLHDRAALMRRVGAVPETPDAPPRSTARELGGLVGRLEPSWSATRYVERLERFRVPMETRLASLSRGQQTQVMLALALASRPELLILDDPTLGLDPLARREVIAELADELAERGTPMLVASHDLTGLERLATHVALLDDRSVVLDEELDALKERLRWISVAADDVPELDALRPLVSRPLPGRGREVLVARSAESTVHALAARHGSHAVDERLATLEDLVVALLGRSSTLDPSEASS